MSCASCSGASSVTAFNSTTRQPSTKRSGMYRFFSGRPFLEAFELFLGPERYASHFQFDFKALLVNLFRESVSAVVINLERSPHKLISFIFVNLGFHSSCSISVY